MSYYRKKFFTGLFFLLVFSLFAGLYGRNVQRDRESEIREAKRRALLERSKFRPELKKLLEEGKNIPSPVRRISPQAVPRNSAALRRVPVSSANKLQPVRHLPKGRVAPVRNTAPRQKTVYRVPPKVVHKIQPKAPLRKAVPARTAVVVKKTAPPSVKIRLIRIGKERYCYLNDVAKYYRMRMKYYKNGVELYAPGRNIRFYNEKRIGSINHVPVSFLYAPVLRAKTQYFIHSKDVAIIISSINSPLYTYSPVKTIMLDPGHGGTDFGALGKNIHEKQMNLAVALLVRASLTALGYKVVMTRSKDVTLSLAKRVALCKEKKPDLYISIHCNAAANKSANGIETFAATPFGVPSTGKKLPAKIKKADPGNAFDRNNYRLSYEIQKALVAQTRANDRGVKVARYMVIREAVCPAALVEIGFITNSAEHKNFLNTAYRKKIVDGLALGIHNYAKSLVVLKPVKR